MEQSPERLTILPGGEITIEGWKTPAGLMVRFCSRNLTMAEYSVADARRVAGMLLADPDPPVGRKKAEIFAHEILAVCDALIQ
jgi:hypothetical protein